MGAGYGMARTASEADVGLQQHTKMRTLARAIIVLLLVHGYALAQEPRSITTSPGTPVPLAFLLNQTTDCDLGLIGLPVLTQPPANGNIQIRIALSNVPAMGTCAARQVPTIALLYVPKSGFVGTDAVSITVELGGRIVQNKYQITVQ